MSSKSKTKKSKKPSFLRKGDVKIEREIIHSRRNIPNYNILSKTEQKYYHSVLIGNFNTLSKIHQINIDFEQLPSNLIELHILYEDYIKEVEIAKTVNRYATYLVTGTKVLSGIGKVIGLDLSQIPKDTKKHLNHYKEYFRCIAEDNYNTNVSTTAIPNPAKDFVNTFALSVGAIIVSKVVENKFGSAYSLMFDEIAEMFNKIPEVRIPEKKEENNVKINIPNVPPLEKKTGFLGI